ncbi:MAG: arginase family protein [Myxococcaceae bacterium]|nr:arginase family protein [Myxococcaceae bacterium]
MKQRRLWFDLADDTLAEPRVAILGLPFDRAVSLREGAALAPERMRAISRTADPISRRGLRVTARVRDYGDVEARDPSGYPLSQQTWLEAARSRLSALPAGAFPLAIGGDNSVSIPAIESFARRHGGDVGILWFDAHPDLFESYDGNRDSHACALRRAMSLAGLGADQVVLLGTRSYAEEELRFIEEQRIELVTAADWLASTTDQLASRITQRLKGFSAIYWCVDIDGFDASCAPGTGYPMPGGVPVESFFQLQERLFAQLPIRGMDITEVAPPLDVNDMTSFLGAQIVLETARLLSETAPALGEGSA